MDGGVVERVELLINQGRFTDAKSMLESHLALHPNDCQSQFYLSYIYLFLGETDKSREISDALLLDSPDKAELISLSASIDLEDEYYTKAESKVDLLLEMNPFSPEVHMLMAKVKYGQRNYTKALEAVDRSLELDPENIEALNFKISLGGLLKDEGTQSALEDVLNLDPENASSIANHGMQLVREGKIDEALERLKYSLSLQPNNPLAQYAMQEALKNKFWPYRMFFKYKEAMARLSGQNAWAVLIGAYFLYTILRRTAANNEALAPFLYPIVFIIAGLFLLTWIIDPLMNLYLSFNKYGKVLLDVKEKKMAQYVGISILIGIICGAIFFATESPTAMYLGLTALLSLIPLGTFLTPVNKSSQSKLKLATFVIIGFGVVGALTGINGLFLVTLLGVFIYQWYFNAILIKENSRVID